MNFFRRRPFVLVMSLGMIAVSAAAFLPAIGKLLLMALVVISVPVVILILRRYDVYHVCSVPALPVMILFAVVTLCMLLTSWAFFDLYALPYNGSYDASVRGTVLALKSSTTYSETYVVRLDSIDGKETNVKGLLYNEGSSSLSIGDAFSAEITFKPLEEFYSIYDLSRGDMLAKGYIFSCEAKDDPIHIGETDDLSVKLALLRASLKAKLSLYLDPDTAAFTNAMLLGDRGDLGKIRRDFVYMGTSHLLAISGLHLAVLSGIFLAFLRALHCPYHLRYTFGIGFIVFYMAITAFPVSVMRSGIMLILAFLSRIVARILDTLTSLFISGGLILLIDPASICDKGFALSFMATLGVILLSEDGKLFLGKIIGSGKDKRRLKNAGEAVFTTVGATVFILPFQWLYFGEVSLLSIPATLLFVPICEMFLCLAFPFAVCALLGLHVLSGRIGWLLSAITAFIELVSDHLARLSPLVSLKYPFVPILIVLALALIAWMMYKNIDSWIYALIPVGASIVLFVFCVQVWNLRFNDETTLSYLHSKNDEAIVLVSAGECMVIDLSSGSRAPMVLACNALKESHQTEVDMLLLTHIHRKHKSSVRALLEERIVRTLILPEPMDEAETSLIRDILSGIEEYRVKVLYYSREDESIIRFGNVSLELPEYTKIKRSTHPLVAINFVTESGRFSYGCGAIWENEYLWRFVGESEHILLGRHGPIYKTPPETIPEGSIALIMPDHPLMDELSAEKLVDIYLLDDDPYPCLLLDP